MSRRHRQGKHTASRGQVAMEPTAKGKFAPRGASGDIEINVNGKALLTGGLTLLVLVLVVALLWRQADLGGEMDGSNLLLVFLTGLTTGGLTCLAIQGGLLATAVAQREAAPVQGTSVLEGHAGPIIMFLAAKLAAYTVLGALLGLFGSLIGLSPTLTAWLQIVVAVFMLGVAGQLLNLHPAFRYFSVQPPRFVQRWIRRESKSGSLLTPAMLGAMTVFMPCATTQAAMIAAMGTGRPVAGAMVMFAFVLGTTPLFFGLGYLATRLGQTMQGWFTKLAAAMIIVLAFVTLTSGLSLLGVPVPNLSPTAWASSAVVAVRTSGVQEAELRAEPTAYVPNQIQFKVGSPARLKVVTGERRGCTSSFVIPSLGVHKILNKNDQVVIDIPTDQPRRIPFTCSMGMYRGVIEVMS